MSALGRCRRARGGSGAPLPRHLGQSARAAQRHGGTCAVHKVQGGAVPGEVWHHDAPHSMHRHVPPRARQCPHVPLQGGVRHRPQQRLLVRGRRPRCCSRRSHVCGRGGVCQRPRESSGARQQACPAPCVPHHRHIAAGVVGETRDRGRGPRPRRWRCHSQQGQAQGAGVIPRHAAQRHGAVGPPRHEDAVCRCKGAGGDAGTGPPLPRQLLCQVQHLCLAAGDVPHLQRLAARGHPQQGLEAVQRRQGCQACRACLHQGRRQALGAQPRAVLQRVQVHGATGVPHGQHGLGGAAKGGQGHDTRVGVG